MMITEIPSRRPLKVSWIFSEKKGVVGYGYEKTEKDLQGYRHGFHFYKDRYPGRETSQDEGLEYRAVKCELKTARVEELFCEGQVLGQRRASRSLITRDDREP